MNKNNILIPHGFHSRRLRQFSAVPLLLATILPLATCELFGKLDNPHDPEGSYLAASRIVLNETTLYCSPGEDIQIAPNIVPLEATRPVIAWTSSYPSIATISQSGLAHALAIGETTITGRIVPARENDPAPSASVTLVVNDGKITSITLPETLIIPPGGTYSIQPSLFPPNSTSRPLTWRSSNNSIATVDSQGLVQAISEGTATIFCEGDGQQGSANVEVNNNAQTVTSLDFVHNPGIMGYDEENETWPAMYLRLNQTYDMDVVWEPTDAATPVLRWSSDNPSIATVDQQGIITAKGIGAARIVASMVNGGYSIAIEVRIEQPLRVNWFSKVLVGDLEFWDHIDLFCGSSLSFVPPVFPSNHEGVLSWTSDNPSILSTDSTGTITAGDQAGSTTLRISATTTEHYRDYWVNVHAIPQDIRVEKYETYDGLSKGPGLIMGTESTLSLAVRSDTFYSDYLPLQASSSNPSLISIPEWVQSNNFTITSGSETGQATIQLEQGDAVLSRDLIVTDTTTTVLDFQAPQANASGSEIIMACGEYVQLVPMVAPLDAVTLWFIQGGDGTATISEEGLLVAGNSPTEFTLYLQSVNEYVSKTVKVVEGPLSTSLSIEAPGFAADEDLLLSAGQSIQLAGVVSPTTSPLTWRIDDSSTGSTINDAGLLTAGPYSGRLFIHLSSPNQSVERWVDIISGQVLDKTSSLAIVAPGFEANETILVSTNSNLQLSALTNPEEAQVSWEIEDYANTGSVSISQDGLLTTRSTTISGGMLRVILSSRNQSVDRYIEIINGPVLDNTTSLAIQAPGFNSTENILVPVGGTIQLTDIKAPQEAAVSWSVWNDDGSISIDDTGLITAGDTLSGCYVRLSSRNDYVDRYIQVIEGPVLCRTDSLQITAPGFNDTESIYLPFGQELQLVADITLSDPNNSLIQWSISNDSTGESSITQEGLLTAGTTATSFYIYLKSRNKSDNRHVYIVDGTVTGVNISPTTLSLTPGEEYQMNGQVTPSYAVNKNLNWYSDNPTVATISSEGVITAHAAGTSKIRVESKELFFTQECNLTVYDDGFRSIHNHYPDLFGNTYYEIDSSTDGNHIVVASGNGVLISHDRGDSWIRGGGTEDTYFTRVSTSDDGTIMLAISNQYLYGSYDAGANWSRLDSAASRSWTDVSIAGDGSVIAACASDSYILQSRDDGVSWTKLSQNTSSWKQLQIDDDGSNVQAITSESSASVYLFTYDAGAWASSTITLEEGNGSISEIYPTVDANTIRARGYSSSIGYALFVTEDGGVTWTIALSINQSYDSLAINGDGTVWLYGPYYNSNLAKWTFDAGTTILQTERGKDGTKRCHVSKDGTLLIYANADYQLFWILDRNL